MYPNVVDAEVRTPHRNSRIVSRPNTCIIDHFVQMGDKTWLEGRARDLMGEREERGVREERGIFQVEIAVWHSFWLCFGLFGCHE